MEAEDLLRITTFDLYLLVLDIYLFYLGCVCHGAEVEVRGHLAEVSSPLWPWGSWGWNSDCQEGRQALLPTESSSHSPRHWSAWVASPRSVFKIMLVAKNVTFLSFNHWGQLRLVRGRSWGRRRDSKAAFMVSTPGVPSAGKGQNPDDHVTSFGRTWGHFLSRGSSQLDIHWL